MRAPNHLQRSQHWRPNSQDLFAQKLTDRAMKRRIPGRRTRRSGGARAKFALYAAVLLIAGVSAATAPHQQHSKPTVLAPGYSTLKFPAPTVGSYQLPPLGTAGDGTVLDVAGRSIRLAELLGDRVVLLSFIFTTCSDVNGCPLATFVLRGVQERLLAEPALVDSVRLISLSFDPDHDTPSVMESYGANFKHEHGDWRFLTTSGEQALTPLLSSWDQSVQQEYDADGNFLGSFSHLLRVFLVDKVGLIRNIYSVSFLHADTVINDIKTVLSSHATTGERALANAISDPADDKRGYEHANYQTRSGAVLSAHDDGIDLYTLTQSPPRGLPGLPQSTRDKLSAEKIALGRKLFYDRRLSHNNTLSCAMCHIPQQGFTSNELATAIGIQGRTVRRNSPSLYNVAYAQKLFHDGRENHLEQQIWGPLLANNEMGNPSVGYVLDELRALSDYQGRFESAFGGQSISMETLGSALASYERSLVSANSPFDRWYFGEQQDAVDNSVKRGFRLFTGKGRCVSCHQIQKHHALFTDQRLHNTGIGYARSMRDEPATRRVLVAPGTYLTVASDVVKDTQPQSNDLGRYEITENPADRWHYKTPTLRNVALTAPYMHDGSLADLDAVVEFYNRGGVKNELLDPLITTLGLTDSEREALVSFLKALTGDNVDAIIADALAVPIGDPD